MRTKILHYKKSYVVGFYNKVFAFVCLLIMSNY